MLWRSVVHHRCELSDRSGFPLAMKRSVPECQQSILCGARLGILSSSGRLLTAFSRSLPLYFPLIFVGCMNCWQGVFPFRICFLSREGFSYEGLEENGWFPVGLWLLCLEAFH